MPKIRIVAGVASLVAAALIVMPINAVTGKPAPAPELAQAVSQGALERVSPPKSRAEAAQRRASLRPLSVGVSAPLRALADQHMSGDPAMEAMLQGAAYKVIKEGPWTRSATTERIGVVREIQLGEAVDMPMRGWPVIYWNDATNDYQRYSYNASWSNVTRVTVFVDDKAGVVALTPDEHAVLKEGPGNEWIQSLPKEAPK